ncbi:MAG: GntR family transcriptional regulator [Anaerocolumna sp.]|nr:GntR family transcriptional regulator [Anaerocolumna sp.]
MENKVTKTTLVDSITERIRKDITMHILVPGDKINLKELSDRYGASETPVRLALNRLITENVIENFPRLGMRIKPLNPNTASETFDLRLMMELYYTKEIIASFKLNSALKDKITQNVEEHMATIQTLTPDSPVEDYLKNYNFDMEFHSLYLKGSGNEMLLDLYHHINPFLYINYIYRRQSQERIIAGVVEHKEIMNAILDGDEALLREKITAHIENSKKSVTMILKIENIV